MPLAITAKHQKNLVTLIGCALVISLAAIDYVTGYEIHVSFFYFVPIAIVAAIVGKRAGVMLCMASATAWFIVDIAAGPPYQTPAFRVWNVAVRLLFFIFVSYGVSSLASTIKKQRDLADFIVHDLKTPLTTVMLSIQSITELGATCGEKVHVLAKTALVSCNRMLTLIHSIIDMSKLQKGELKADMKDASIREMVEAAVEQVSVWAGKKNIPIVCSINTDRNTVNTDFWLVVRILINLLSNAIKASPESSKVELIVSEPKHGALAFSVVDNGCGYTPHKIPLLSLHAGVDAHKGAAGSGLGLLFCALASKTLGADFSIHGEDGKGTVAKIELPVID